jgi:hypothetical protein
MGGDFTNFREGATYAKERTYQGYQFHMYELTNGMYHLKSISDVSGPYYDSGGIIPGSDKFEPDVVLLKEYQGGLVVIKRNSQGNYVIDGTLDPSAVPILSLSYDITWRRTTSGEDITYLYVDAGLEYELKKEAGVWSWGFSSRPNPPLSNPRSFLLNENEFIYVSEYHNPLVVKIFNFNGTDWNTVLDYEESIYNPPYSETSMDVSTCTLVEIQEGEVFMTSSLVKWGNASGVFSTDTSDYTIEKTNGTWGVSKEVTLDRIDNYTSPSIGSLSACSITVSYFLTDKSRVFYEVPYARTVMGFDDPVRLYKRFSNGTKDVLFETPVTLELFWGATVMENLDKFVIFDSQRSAADVYDLSNGGFALEDTLNFTFEGSPIDTFLVVLTAVADSLVVAFNSQRFLIGGFN